MTKKIALTSIVVASLSACVGGSGGGAPAISPPPVVTGPIDANTNMEKIRAAAASAIVTGKVLQVGQDPATGDTVIIRASNAADADIDSFISQKAEASVTCASAGPNCTIEPLPYDPAILPDAGGGAFFDKIVYTLGDGTTIENTGVYVSNASSAQVEVGFLCQLDADNVCVKGTLRSFANGTPFGALPEPSGNVTYAVFFYGNGFESDMTEFAEAGNILVDLNLATGQATLATVGTSRIEFTGTLVVDKETGLLGSNDITVSLDAGDPQAGYILGMLNGASGEMISGIAGSDRAVGTGFDFNSVFAGAVQPPVQ